jgi:hypothetical protein
VSGAVRSATSAEWAVALALPVIGACLLIAAASLAEAEARPSACPPQPTTLSPGGGAQDRFTMMLRVNQLHNAQTYASSDEAAGGLAGRIRPQDLFVVNTRFYKSNLEEWANIVGTLRAAFPCNRIVSLNGLGADPNAPGYAYALHHSPDLWAMLTDWEQLDWNSARWSNPEIGSWTWRFDRSEKRVRRWIGGLTYAFALTPGTKSRRAGIAPQFSRKWDYGLLARAVSGPHRRITPAMRGIQSVQSQDFCANHGGRGMKKVSGRLLRAYKLANFRRLRIKGERRRGGKRFRYRKRKWKTTPRNLGMQISFSGTPDPASGMAVLNTSPQRAAKCTRTALKRGGGAFLYWASPDSMRALFSVGRICVLRPPRSGTC